MRPGFERNDAKERPRGKSSGRFGEKCLTFAAEFSRVHELPHTQVGSVPHPAIAILQAEVQPFRFGSIEAEFGAAEADFLRQGVRESVSQEPFAPAIAKHESRRATQEKLHEWADEGELVPGV